MLLLPCSNSERSNSIGGAIQKNRPERFTMVLVSKTIVSNGFPMVFGAIQKNRPER